MVWCENSHNILEYKSEQTLDLYRSVVGLSQDPRCESRSVRSLPRILEVSQLVHCHRWCSIIKNYTPCYQGSLFVTFLLFVAVRDLRSVGGQCRFICSQLQYAVSSFIFTALEIARRMKVWMKHNSRHRSWSKLCPATRYFSSLSGRTVSMDSI